MPIKTLARANQKDFGVMAYPCTWLERKRKERRNAGGSVMVMYGLEKISGPWLRSRGPAHSSDSLAFILRKRYYKNSSK